jgi:hypothetical protein
MKSYDITKPLVDTLLGSGLRTQITDAERSVYQQSHQWIDYNVFVTNRDWERDRMKKLREYASHWLRREMLVDLKLNKNIKIL